MLWALLQQVSAPPQDTPQISNLSMWVSSQTSEREMLQKEHGGRTAAAGGASEEVLYKFDIPANRYDMLCLEGIARALNIFARRVPRVEYRLADMTGEGRLACPGASAMCCWMRSCRRGNFCETSAGFVLIWDTCYWRYLVSCSRQLSNVFPGLLHAEAVVGSSTASAALRPQQRQS